jgi:hypothetical protein
MTVEMTTQSHSELDTRAELDAALDIAYWRAIGGARALSTRLPVAPRRYAFTGGELEALAASIGQQGYFITRPIVPAASRAKLLGLIDRITRSGLNPLWAMLFDEFWHTFARIGSVLETILGRDYRYVTGDYVFIVDNTDAAAGWGKHRDLQFARSIDADNRPRIMSCWVALTDATPLNSCLYCLPYSRDPNFPENLAELAVPRVEDIECMQVRAGQVIGLSHALLHWGSRSSARGAARRVSFVFDAQRGDIAGYHHALLDPAERLSFAQRAAYVGHVVFWLKRNNVGFGSRDLAIAKQLVERYGQTIGLTPRFFEIYVEPSAPAAAARYAAPAL